MPATFREEHDLVSLFPFPRQYWIGDVAGHGVELPIVAIGADFAIAVMMVIDLGVDFLARVGSELAGRVRHVETEIVVGSATLDIPTLREGDRLGFEGVSSLGDGSRRPFHSFFMRSGEGRHVFRLLVSKVSLGAAPIRSRGRATPLRIVAGKSYRRADDLTRA